MLRIEPLDPARHDRASFSSGIEAVDNYFRRTANKLVGAGNLRVFVLVSPEDELIGFYALNAHAVDFADLPPRYARTRPGHGSIPAAFLSMFGVDSRWQNEGHGSVLLIDALRRVVRASESLGIAVVVLDIVDCGDEQKVARRRKLYESYGFRSLPSKPLRLFLPVASAQAAVAGLGG